MKPTQEQILLSLAKSRPGVEIKFENGRLLGKLEFFKTEFAWTILAYEDEIHFNVTGAICWRGWSI
jgi:hypothetical protein